MNKTKNIIIVTLMLFSVVAITVGVTFAFFSYAKQGTTENAITTRSIEFLYTEVDKVGAGIAIEDAYPISDTQGKAQTGAGKVFNFKVTSLVSNTIDIPYTVTARKKNVDNSLDDAAVRVYLTEVSGTSENGLLLDNYGSLDDYQNAPVGYTEKVIYNGNVAAGNSNYEKDFRLRIWIDSDVKFSPIENQDGTITYPYNDKTFTVTVNVYANAKVVTESSNAQN